ncbi:follistatin-related protein 1-like [Menidia menidia]
MFSFSGLLLLLLLSSPASSSPLTKDQSVCARTFCGAGRECVSTDRGEPVCRCLQQCGGAEHWVCGSNGKSYRSHCELHREACTARVKIHAEHRGRCTERPPKPEASPMVCLLSDRDWLRKRVIRWIQAEGESGHLGPGVLKTYFQTYDDGDSQLDSKEFLRFLNHNETALNLTFPNTPETNPLLRSLCVDALIELSDENADWKLSFPEFTNCLTPSYQPPERKCALEDEAYEDGAETQMQCNKCVCACGNWVCTALTCNGERQIREDGPERGEQEEMTEEEWNRRVAELNTLQATLTT